MSQVKPVYWGNIIYETAMGIYHDEEEAKKDSWMQEHFFPLYEQEDIDKLEKDLKFANEQIAKYQKYFQDNVMVPNDEYDKICKERLSK